MAERLKIDGNFLIIFEVGNPSNEYINAQRVDVTPKYDENDNVRFYSKGSLIGEDVVEFDCSTIINDDTGSVFPSVANLKTFLSGKLGDCCTSNSGGGVQSVTGDGVGGTATDPVLTFPTLAEIGAKADFTENTAFNKNFGTSSGEVQDAGTYDPNGIGSDAFDYGNFLGTFQIKGTPVTVNLSSDIDNLNATSNIINLTTSSQDRRITGIVAPPAGVNRVILFYSQSSQYRIKFVHQSGSSTVANRIVLRGQAGTRNLLQYQMAVVSYNHSLNRWYVSRIG